MPTTRAREPPSPGAAEAASALMVTVDARTIIANTGRTATALLMIRLRGIEPQGIPTAMITGIRNREIQLDLHRRMGMSPIIGRNQPSCSQLDRLQTRL